MPRFMDVHTEMKDITQEQLAQAHQEDLKNEKPEGVHFMKAWADPATRVDHAIQALQKSLQLPYS